jgi:hypothetical protein
MLNLLGAEYLEAGVHVDPPADPPLHHPATWILGAGAHASHYVPRHQGSDHSTHIGRDETGSVYLPTQLERTLQLYW